MNDVHFDTDMVDKTIGNEIDFSERNDSNNNSS